MDKIYNFEVDEAAFFDTVMGLSLPLKSNKDIEYYNIPVSFDVESTSTYDNGQKVAFVYVWQFDFNGIIIYGRALDDYITFTNHLVDALQLNAKRQLIVYVHNLAHEFAFISHLYEWEDVFALEARKVCYATTKTGLCYRCSYILTNQSLDSVGKNLRRPVKKLTGSLDYNKIRLTITPLTSDELEYCFNDVRIVVELISERIEDEDGDITQIPLTSTGYVRRDIRKKCLYDYKKGSGRARKHTDNDYRHLMERLTIEPDEYVLAKKAFSGGFTHSNSINTGITFSDVYSFDLTSSYPSVMLSEQYPMTKGRWTTFTSRPDFEQALKSKCMIFELTLCDLELQDPLGECYISESHCERKQGVVVNNGRVASAKLIKTTVTNIDFEIIRKTYNFSQIQIGKCIVYEKDYLPGRFVRAICDLYVKKTKLKGVKGSEKDYMNSKALLNSAYGMCVTDIVRDKPVYTAGNVWMNAPESLEEQIDKYNKSKKRFLFYPWGVFVTAYARRNLFSLILEAGPDYIYSDTDSVKMLNMNKHLAFIEEYNRIITKKIERCLSRSGADKADASPKDINGVSHPLGFWDCETPHGYKRFKTLGAKRYIYEAEDGLHITIAGVNKQAGANYLGSLPNPFDAFTENLEIPVEGTGKLTHTYIDTQVEGNLTDYLGHQGSYKAPSGVHLEPTTYNLSIGESYKLYLAHAREVYET